MKNINNVCVKMTLLGIYACVKAQLHRTIGGLKNGYECPGEAPLSGWQCGHYLVLLLIFLCIYTQLLLKSCEIHNSLRASVFYRIL